MTVSFGSTDHRLVCDSCDDLRAKVDLLKQREKVLVEALKTAESIANNWRIHWQCMGNKPMADKAVRDLKQIRAALAEQSTNAPGAV